MAKAKAVVAILRKAEVGIVTLQQRQDNKVPVVKCSNIQIGKLKDKIDQMNGKHPEMAMIGSSSINSL